MTTAKWHAEIHITEEIVVACIENQFPCLMPIKNFLYLGEGWDNKAYLINDEIIFRFPRRYVSVDLINRENQLLQKLTSLLNITIPNPIYQGNPSSTFPYPFHGYHVINGKSGCHAGLSLHEREASIKTLAIILKQLHSIETSKVVTMGVSSPVFDRADIKKVITGIEDYTSKLNLISSYTINKKQLSDEIKLIQNIELNTSDNCLIHGDLYCRHLIFDKGQLTGVIDWGDACINNKAVDISVIFGFYPADCHQDFLEIYGELKPEIWQYARFFALYSAFSMLLYGMDINDNLLVQESIDSINRINPHLLAINE